MYTVKILDNYDLKKNILHLNWLLYYIKMFANTLTNKNTECHLVYLSAGCDAAGTQTKLLTCMLQNSVIH